MTTVIGTAGSTPEDSSNKEYMMSHHHTALAVSEHLTYIRGLGAALLRCSCAVPLCNIGSKAGYTGYRGHSLSNTF
eukprot:1155624-Pelagomonas_calceolata.AAC.3